MAFFRFPKWAQHPIRAVPRASFPKYARVGIYIGVGSGVKRLWKRDLVIQARSDVADQIRREDEEILELIIAIVTSGKLDE